MNQLLILKGGKVLNNLCMLFTIVNFKDEKKVIKLLDKYKVVFKVITHGTGTASSSILEYFGLNDDEKSIVVSVIPTITCKHILKEIEEKQQLKKHGNGIAFSIPLSSSTRYLVDFYSKHEMEEIEMEEAKQHLIITITNQGYAEKVMTEAKKAGATGGTTINGRGLNNENIIKFLNISIEPEKDIVLILTETKNKNNIMNSIVENCGLKTPGAGICFSLPVDYAIGLNKEIKNIEKK